MILITGASSGIGKFLFEKFIDSGEKVYGTYLNSPPPLRYKDLFTSVDVSNYESVDKWISTISKDTNIVLINCAGINYNSFAHKADVDNWKKIIDVNLTGTFNVIRATLPLMRDNNYGRIINLSSVVAQLGVPGTSAYAASKSGLNGLVKAISKENAEKGITINNLNLGYFDLGIIREVSDEMQNKMKDSIPNHEFGEAEDIFNTILTLIKTPYINGTSIDINGGLY
jgi:acetoacetyl-CoA reductase/3-oxoacyl-[acyl-carrier protein] reductase